MIAGRGIESDGSLEPVRVVRPDGLPVIFGRHPDRSIDVVRWSGFGAFYSEEELALLGQGSVNRGAFRLIEAYTETPNTELEHLRLRKPLAEEIDLLGGAERITVSEEPEVSPLDIIAEARSLALFHTRRLRTDSDLNFFSSRRQGYLSEWHQLIRGIDVSTLPEAEEEGVIKPGAKGVDYGDDIERFYVVVTETAGMFPGYVVNHELEHYYAFFLQGVPASLEVSIQRGAYGTFRYGWGVRPRLPDGTPRDIERKKRRIAIWAVSGDGEVDKKFS